MSTIPVSVVILAHRDDSRFNAAVASVSWAAEILVIWAGSQQLQPNPETDHFRVLFLGDEVQSFAHLRNVALSNAIYEWVFFLDSDEVFNENGLPELQKTITNPLIDGAMVHRHDVFLQKEMKHGEIGQVTITRLVRKQKTKFERTVHEVAVVKGHVIQTKIVIYHFSHCSVADFLSKIIHYIQLEKRERTQQQQKFKLSEMLVYPSAKFIQNYFFRLGFLDGWRGLIYATMMSVHSFGVRASLYEGDRKQT